MKKFQSLFISICKKKNPKDKKETNNNLSQKKSDETNYMKSFVWYREENGTGETKEKKEKEGERQNEKN